ncbi:histone deacetylase 8-like [Haliotis asinina]|uniref:histone deacetylase 8-like n=1 Tax=Haliotis asinina TaxID=109174 RepID=UPI0035322F1B
MNGTAQEVETKRKSGTDQSDHFPNMAKISANPPQGSNNIDIYDIDNDDSQNSVDLTGNYCHDMVSVKQNDSVNDNPDVTKNPSKKRRLCGTVTCVSNQTSPLSLTDVKGNCCFSEDKMSQGQNASVITASEDRVESEILHPSKLLSHVCDKDNDENRPDIQRVRHDGAYLVHTKDQEHQGHLSNSQSNLRLQADVRNMDGYEGGSIINQTSKVLEVNNCDKMYASKGNSEPQDVSNSVDVYEITDCDEHSQPLTPLHKRKRVLQARNEDVSKPNSPSKMKDSACDDSKEAAIVGSRNGPSRIGYIYSEAYLDVCDKMPRVEQRASMVHRLIEAYGLVKYMKLIPPREATASELLQFHSPEYIQFLEKISDQEDEEKYDQEAEQFGLTYDCPVHVGVYEYAVLVAGATVCAAELLVDGSCDIAMNWCGGWHHAKRDSASGFCYVNDIVLGILKLRQCFERVLYVDIDLHHGDGVEDAFCTTSKVLTVSFHKYLSGFFPGTGSLRDVGISKGKYYSVNVPLLDGIKDTEFTALFNRVMTKVKEKFRPEAVVCQCGADGIAGDPMESFNLTPLGLGRCVYTLQSWKVPLLLLGGGGYNHVNTAKCWAFLTSLAIGKKLPQDVPDHKFFMKYGPDYDLSVSVGNRKDNNSRDYLSKVYRQIMENLNHLTS